MSSLLSGERARLIGLERQARRLLPSFLGRDALLPGCVYMLRRRCGKPTCRCARGGWHVTEVLSYRGEGRPRNITPRPGELGEWRRLTERYGRFRRARAEWVKLQREVLAAIDRIQALRVAEGKRRFRPEGSGKR